MSVTLYVQLGKKSFSVIQRELLNTSFTPQFLTVLQRENKIDTGGNKSKKHYFAKTKTRAEEPVFLSRTVNRNSKPILRFTNYFSWTLTIVAGCQGTNQKRGQFLQPIRRQGAH